MKSSKPCSRYGARLCPRGLRPIGANPTTPYDHKTLRQSHKRSLRSTAPCTPFADRLAYVTVAPRVSLSSFCARCSTFSAAISTGKTGESHSAYSPSLLVYRQPAQIANTQRGFPNNRPNIPRLSSMGHQTRRDSLMRDFASSSALNARKSSHEGRFVQGMRTPLRLSIMMQGR